MRRALRGGGPKLFVGAQAEGPAWRLPAPPFITPILNHLTLVKKQTSFEISRA